MRASLVVISFIVGITQCLSQSPGVRNGHNMVFYKPSDKIILFGGADDTKVYGDTWSFSDNKWKKITDEGPSPRTFPCMVVADRYILLFGGNAVLFGNESNPVHYLDDTWKFQNNKWSKVSTPIHPPPRAEAAISYDPRRKKVVLFGGRQAGEKWVLGDTWEFDGNQWNELHVEGPVPRSGAVMVYDDELHQVVLFGGNPVIANEKNYNGPMWSFDGRTWIPLKSMDPLIFNSCMAHNSKDHFILRFGGWNGHERVNDTWIYQHNGWKKLELSLAPAARNHSIMVYDSRKNSFYLYGGHDGENVFGDMWSFKNGKWKFLVGEKPRKRIENGH